MSTCGCNFKCSCTLVALMISLLAGVIGAFLRITAAVTLTPVTYWVLFGIAVAYLGVLAASAGGTQHYSCCCAELSSVILGILGTILFSGILLLVTFEATSILGAIMVGLLFASFALIIAGTICLIRCISGCRE